MRFLLLCLPLLGACSPVDTTSGRFRVDAWADNWFSVSLGETQVIEDSVPITTERSFNKESFSFDGAWPLALNWVLKDYKKNDSGLEYIGQANQQLGDGGFIAQITDTTTGRRILVSSAAWKCLVIHRAPTNVACEKSASPETECQSEISAEPSGWKLPTFDASAWPSAVEYTAAQVGPKDGYTQVTWDPAARLIWSSSLKQDNTLLCKVIVNEPG